MTGRTEEAGPAPTGLVGHRAEKTVSLALQGGGAHGAFTWGVLDRLIEDGRLSFEAITGASAGAMNAVVMTAGWLEGGPEGARAKLAAFWRRISLDGCLSQPSRDLFRMLFGPWLPGADNPVLAFWRGTLSPAQLNPLDINPLRDVIRELVDFERLRSCDTKLFVSATNVRTGKIRLFETTELSCDAVLASACLPTVFRTVVIDGEAYWDGGYMGNPALFPLFYKTGSDDVVLIQINPIERAEIPEGPAEIASRMDEIVFNSGLLGEFRAIEFVTRLIDQGKLSRDDYKRLLMHRIEGGPAIARYSAATRLDAEWDFLLTLKEIGREVAAAWLDAHFAALGRRATLDLREAYM